MHAGWSRTSFRLHDTFIPLPAGNCNGPLVLEAISKPCTTGWICDSYLRAEQNRENGQRQRSVADGDLLDQENRPHAARAGPAVGRDAWGEARGGMGVVHGSSESGGGNHGPGDALRLNVYRLSGDGMGAGHRAPREQNLAAPLDNRGMVL
jgi:hypothetical protein